MHLVRLRRWGDVGPATQQRGGPVLERIMARTSINADGCWTLAGRSYNGYRHVKIDGKSAIAHRAVYTLIVGPIPDGLQLDHLCRNRACVNPAHLEPVTARQNTLRSAAPSAVNAAKTECIKGHPFDDANTILRRGGQARACRECCLAAKRRWRQRQRGLAA
jgi:hypothetical protein